MAATIPRDCVLRRRGDEDRHTEGPREDVGGGDGVHAPGRGASGRPASDVSPQSCNSTRLCGVTHPSPRSRVPAARPEVTETTADPEERHGSLGRRAVARPGRRTSAGVSGLRGGRSREGGALEGQARPRVSLRPANRAQPSFPAPDNECPRSGERTRVCQARVHTAGHTCTPPLGWAGDSGSPGSERVTGI